MGNTMMWGMKAVKNEIATGIEAVAARFNPDMERTKSAGVGKKWMDAAKEDFENVREAAQGNGRYDDTSRTAIEQEIQDRRRIFKLMPLEMYRKVTNWATNVGDEVFIKHHYARALAGYLRANGVTVEQYLEGNVDQRLLSRATDFAIREAQEATFHDNNAFSDWVSKLGRRETTPQAVRLIAEGVAPFRKTPANVLARAYEYSPLGLIDTVSKAVDVRKGDATASDVINSAARVLTGTGILALGLALRAAGWLRGTGDPDDEEMDALMDRQDYSITIPGVGSYTIDWLTPATMPLFMGANLWDIIDENDWSLENFDSMLAQFTEPILETSMLSGVNDAISNVKFSENHLMQTAVTYALSYVTQGLTNSLLGQAERAAEPNRMTTYTSKDNPMQDWLERSLGQASARMPGVDFQQTEYRDEFGQTESNGDPVWRLFENLISLGYWSPTREGQELYDGLQEIHDQTGANPWPDAYPPSSLTVDGEKINLSQAEKERYQETQGSIYLDLAGALLGDESAELTPEELADILSDIKSYAGSQAKQELYDARGIDKEASTNSVDKAVQAAEEGITIAQYYRLKDEHDRINEGGGSAYDKITEWAHYLDQTGLTSGQIAKMQELLGYSSGFAVHDADHYADMKANGLSSDKSQNVFVTVSALEPEDGKEQVSTLQKVGAIVGVQGLSVEEQLGAIKAYMKATPETYQKYEDSYKQANIPPAVYYQYLVDKKNYNYELDSKGHKKTKEGVVDIIGSMDLTNEQKDWLYTLEGYKGKIYWH